MSITTGKQKLTRKTVNHESVDYMKVSKESDENLLITESYPPTIKKPSSLLTKSVHSSFYSSSSASSSLSSSPSTSTSTITTIRNVDQQSSPSPPTVENADDTELGQQSSGTIKPRKPRLFRQPNALMDASPNHPSSSSSSSFHGDTSNPISSTTIKPFRPVPQVSVTLSSPENPFDDPSIEFIDSDNEQQHDHHSQQQQQQQLIRSNVKSDNRVKTNSLVNEKVRNQGEPNQTELANEKTGANSVDQSNRESAAIRTRSASGPEPAIVAIDVNEGRSKTKYLTRTLALLKLQYSRKSRSEESGDPETRNIRRLSERPVIGNSLTSSTHLHGPIANKSLSSASLCGSSLATSPPTFAHHLRGSNEKASNEQIGTNDNDDDDRSGSGRDGINPPVSENVPNLEPNQDEPEPYILGIHVHNTDRKLKTGKSVVHPVVKIHIIDTKTGSYLAKKHSDRDVAFYYETGNSKNNFILPVMTQNCDMLTKVHYPRYPIWEELLLYNEDYSHFLSDNVVIFFEILDFLTFSGSSDQRYNSMKRTEWWYRIAWAFLTLRSSDGSVNTGRKLRLQLYKPLSQKVTIDRKNPHTTEIYEWYNCQRFILFPGSIYVTVSPIPLIVSRETFCPSLRSYGPFQPESNSAFNYPQNYINQPEIVHYQTQDNHHHHHHLNKKTDLPCRPSSTSNSTIERSSSTTSNGSQNGQSIGLSKSLDTSLESRLATGSGHNVNSKIQDRNQEIVIWNRLEGGPCKIPKNFWHQFSAGNNKLNYVVRFSWDGRQVACSASVFHANHFEKRSSIFIYEIPSGKFLRRVNGFHQGLIYDIDWSPNDRYLVSASADNTAHVWNNVKEYQSYILLPHPCYVYSALFHVTRSGIIFTGGFDGIVRVWCIKLSLESTAVEPQLVQEIDCFFGQVLSLAWKIIPPTPTPSTSNSLAATNSRETTDINSIPIVNLFACGSKGEIVTLSQRDLTSDFTWYLSEAIKIAEVDDIPINNIVVHPHSNKILIFCRDGVHRMIDYELELIVQRYKDSPESIHLNRGCISPCGRFIFAGTDNGLVYCWNAETGEIILIYNELPFKGPISRIEFHPLDNILAICGLNARTISVCLFNHEIPKVISATPAIGQSSKMLTTSNSSSSKQGSPRHSNHSKSEPSSKSFIGGRKFELLKSKTIDHSNANSTSTNVSEMGAIRRGNFKVQQAMRRIEFALRTKSTDKR